MLNAGVALTNVPIKKYGRGIPERAKRVRICRRRYLKKGEPLALCASGGEALLDRVLDCGKLARSAYLFAATRAYARDCLFVSL